MPALAGASDSLHSNGRTPFSFDLRSGREGCAAAHPSLGYGVSLRSSRVRRVRGRERNRRSPGRLHVSSWAGEHRGNSHAEAPSGSWNSSVGMDSPNVQAAQSCQSVCVSIGQGDDAEVAKLVEHIATLGMKELGVVFWNDPAIRDVVQIVEQEVARRRLTIKILLSTETAEKADLKEVAKTLITINPPAVVVMLPVGETARRQPTDPLALPRGTYSPCSNDHPSCACRVSSIIFQRSRKCSKPSL